MERFIIRGGRKLDGKIKIESAKNAVLPMMAGAILTKERVVILDCPMINDVLNMTKILQSIGVSTCFSEGNLIIDSKNLKSCEIKDYLMKELRSSIFMMGALLGRTNTCTIYSPGGCSIGDRPINYHLEGFRKLGVKIKEEQDAIICKSFNKKGGIINLPFPSVGATENFILACVIQKGTTIINNCAKEPEIKDLSNFLNSMGARISGAGTRKIIIEGVKSLHGTEYRPISDRIETGTYLLSALICGGNIALINADKKNICSLIKKFCNNTCKISINNDIIYIKNGIVGNGFNLVTGPYPAFATDLQAQCLVLASISKGQSIIKDTVFSDRFNYALELTKMGADIKVNNGTAIVNGVKELVGNELYANDLRGGASLCLASMVAQGQSVVYGVNHIDRGYLAFDGKLQQLGVDINRVF